MKSWWTYILINHTNSVLYVGVTNDIVRRLYEHRHRIDNDSFTSKYRLYKLVWFQEFSDPAEAISAEKKIKGWTRAKKINLIRNNNPKFASLDSSPSQAQAQNDA